MCCYGNPKLSNDNGESHAYKTFSCFFLLLLVGWKDMELRHQELKLKTTFRIQMTGTQGQRNKPTLSVALHIHSTTSFFVEQKFNVSSYELSGNEQFLFMNTAHNNKVQLAINLTNTEPLPPTASSQKNNFVLKHSTHFKEQIIFVTNLGLQAVTFS
jgi:hypothetical protein